MKTAALLVALCRSLAALAVQTSALCTYTLTNPDLLAEVCGYMDAYVSGGSVNAYEDSIAGYSMLGNYSLYLNLRQSVASQHGLNNFSENVRFHERYQPGMEIGTQFTSVDRHQQIGLHLESRSFTEFINDLAQSNRHQQEIRDIFQLSDSLYLRSAQSLYHLYTVSLPDTIDEQLIDSLSQEPSNWLGRMARHLVSNFISRVTPDIFINSQQTPTEGERIRWRNQQGAISSILGNMPVSLFSLNCLYRVSVTRIYRCPHAEHLGFVPIALICPYWRPSLNFREWRRDKHRDNKKYLRRKIRDRINPRPGGRSLFRGALERLSF